MYLLTYINSYRTVLIKRMHAFACAFLCMYAGLRVGEACGIKKQDLIGNRLTITRQVSQEGLIST